MSRYLILLFLVSCASPAPAQYHQGVYRPAAPMFVPSQDAPHTIGQPGHLQPQREELPRSPHKRLLPPTREPGLWSGDQPKASAGPGTAPQIAGVPIVLSPDRVTGKVRDPHPSCADQMNTVIETENLLPRIERLDPKVRACLVGHLYAECVTVLEKQNRRIAHKNAEGTWRSTGRRGANPKELPGPSDRETDALAFRGQQCRSTGLDREATAILTDAVGSWALENARHQ